MTAHGTANMTLSKGFVVASLIAALVIYGALSPRFLPGEKEMIAVLPLLALMFSIQGRPAPQWPLAAFAVVAVTALGGLLFQERLYPSWIASSLATIGGLLLFPYAAYRGVRLVEGANLRLILVASAVAALIAPLLPDTQDFNRFEPPNFLIFAALTTAVLVAPRRWQRRMAVAAILVGLCLAYLSQWRIVFALQVGALVGLLCLRWPVAAMAAAILAGLSVGVYIAFGDTGMMTADWVGPRYHKLLSYDGFRAELGVRFLEVRDVAAQIGENGNLFTTLFGFGHGATFFARNTLSELGTDIADWQSRFTDSTHAFTIHFGPVRLFFRYGLIGLAGWLGLFWLTARHALHHVRQPRAAINPALLIGALACLLYLARSLFQPVEHDFLFWVSIALFFSARRSQREKQAAVALRRDAVQPPRNAVSA